MSSRRCFAPWQRWEWSWASSNWPASLSGAQLYKAGLGPKGAAAGNLKGGRGLGTNASRSRSTTRPT
eukprot:6978238-Pyramimonas_sp.AAC.1